MHLSALNALTTEPTRKQFWLFAFTAALHRLSVPEAIQEADQALKLCDERWHTPPAIGSLNYEHDYPVGHAFRRPE